MISKFLNQYCRLLQKRHPNILFHGDESSRAIALTFDDGPHPRDTPRVLELLEKYNIRATFFVVGNNAEQYPDIVKQIHHGGHQLGIHCFRHIPFPLENSSVLHTQLEHTRHMIADKCGVPPETIKDLRPPFGAFNAQTLTHLTEWGFRLVMWSCIPPHWMQPVNWSIRQVMESTVPGAVIVLHDGHGHGRRVAEVMHVVVPQIKSRGFEFVTVEEMQHQREQVAA